MKTMSTLVYIPVLFTMLTACGPRQKHGSPKAIGATTSNTQNGPTSQAESEAAVAQMAAEQPAPTEVTPAAQPAMTPAEEDKMLGARVAELKNTLWTQFRLPFDKVKVMVAIGYYAKEKNQINTILKKIGADTARQLEIADRADVRATHKKAYKLMKHFPAAADGQ